MPIIYAREDAAYICNDCYKHFNLILKYRNCTFDYYDIRNRYSLSSWFIYSQLLLYRDVRVVITSIDTQLILLIGKQYYITEAPIPPAAIHIIGDRNRLRLNHDIHIKKNEDKYFKSLNIA